MTDAEKIQQTCDLLGLTPNALARAMQISPNTMYRWLKGKSTPKGLSRTVLGGMYQAAIILAEREDGERLAKLAGAKVSLGVGALLFYGLKDLKGA